MKGIAVSLAFALAGCSSSVSVDYENAVKRELRDPESAQFSDVVVNVESACGFVNSKNGFGGYVGRQPFVVVGEEATLLEPTAEASGLVNARCQEPAKAMINAWLSEAAISALEEP
ncbi:hypothetical protein [Sphingopyxis fribergensis]